MTLKKIKGISWTLKIFLNGKLEMDSNGVDYNLCGTVLERDFIKNIEHVYLSDSHVLTLSDCYVDEEVVVAQNTGEDCLKLYVVNHSIKFALLPLKHVEKVEFTETTKTTLTP